MAFTKSMLRTLYVEWSRKNSSPLEAQRLGLEAYVSDLNPVAILINKAMIEIPPKFANRPPIEITPAMVEERPDLRIYEGQKLTVIAWLWARTVKSPNPAFSHIDVPLASTFILSSKPGKEAWVEPVINNPPRQQGIEAAKVKSLADASGYKFTVKVGKPPAEAKAGTSAGKRKAFRCVISGVPMDFDYLRAEGCAGRMGSKLMAMVAEGVKGRVYLSPTSEHESIASSAIPTWRPETPIPEKALGIRVPLYGMKSYGSLFTSRQLVALTTFSDLVGEAREDSR